MAEDDENEGALWARFTKGMKPLPKPPVPDEEKPRARRKRAISSPPAPLDSAAIPAPETRVTPATLPGTDLDRRTEERLLSGKMPLDGRIDLHGMTQAQAQRALSFFMAESLAAGRRTVLVITGKGRGGAVASETPPEDWFSPKPGVLRQNMPRWLEAPDIKPHILKIVPAQPRHGGAGAFYIYLRRSRPS
jgi:DNA-nicking Smr family endonuclease